MERKVAWVIGGSAGIGLAIARTLAEAGYHTVISARSVQTLQSPFADIVEAGGACDAIAVDVTDRSAVNAAAQAILAANGRVDLLVNNAGFDSQKREWNDLFPGNSTP
jgi:NADP-dependent 3-hydroxy acid dehydrogenase YdfG